MHSREGGGTPSAENRQRPNPLLGSSKDCITQRRRQRWHRGLTRAARSFLALHKVSFHDRSFTHPDRRIIIEITLHHPALVDCDPCPYRVGQPIDHSTLYLLLQYIGIDDLP